MYKTILHATDLSENHYNLCQQAVKLAQCFKASLHFLHVIETPASLQWAQSLGFAELATPVKDDAITTMATLGEALNIPLAHQHVEVGSAYSHILNKANELNCDLIIIGSHSRHSLPPFLGSSFLGSTANTIVHHAPCAVLTLKAE
ncbi:universal stress protein A UspA [Legionella beliardensis]|uniref:Universal stress protein n=1 Tax=Legionella beliardensis TaxID=91822 RepID=A0A378I2A0_9GAMM|nr:universal stress protein [Legionella beliardensis]STX29123.1 universal stress protein A UspA [Legionella beliardensis]